MSQGSTNPLQQINGPELNLPNTQTRVVNTTKKGVRTSHNVRDDAILEAMSRQTEILEEIRDLLMELNS